MGAHSSVDLRATVPERAQLSCGGYGVVTTSPATQRNVRVLVSTRERSPLDIWDEYCRNRFLQLAPHPRLDPSYVACER